ncbi:15374_t:CDS:2 [Cetraspora pellucida]|uniref:15374_t:CDS:1 n=1 Tax=Cetraspora pellucida TaxID=1433469 RepID=A0A9N9IGL3_9GLOM|nr:15374_t:CDS:2 [Cetraspora pellucida]
MRTCYYELLDVEQYVTTEELKKAYRKKALEWHPDKNHHRVAEATEQFTLLQQAYEVLSDPNEREWYDNHRDAILREGISVEDLMKYFNIGCYSGFDDSSKGFYTVYRSIFEQLAREEEEAYARDREENSSEFLPYPSFGDSTTSPDQESPQYGNLIKYFYQSWLNFFTRKKFAWFDKHRLSEAPDRWAKKKMEVENEKSRKLARKEYNDTVKLLVEFVQKRDPRYQAYKMAADQKNKAQLVEAKKRSVRDRAEHLSKLKEYQEQEWTKEEMFEDNEDLINLDDQNKANHNDIDELVNENTKDIEDNLFTKSSKKKKKPKKRQLTPNWGHEEAEDEVVLDKIKSDSPNDDDELSEQLNKTKISSRGGFESEEESNKTQPLLNIDDDNSIKQENGTKKEKKKDKKKSKDLKQQKCNVCSQTFTSRNSLFTHIKETGHALNVSGSGGGKKGRK